MTEVKEGTRWGDTSGNVFHVISVVDVNDHTWVHYEQDGVSDIRIFSCWIESFLHRFNPIINDQRSR